MNDSAFLPAIRLIRERLTRVQPVVVALDGRSGAGKSTLAQRLAALVPAVIVEGDDFFAGGVELRHDAPHERAAACIDWRAQRRVLEAMRRGERASSHRFDWNAFDGSREREATVYEPAPVVLLEGVYSGRPELADLVDLAMLLRVPREQRIAQLVAREGVISPWERQWHEAEDHYFTAVVSAERFNLVIEPEVAGGVEPTGVGS